MKFTEEALVEAVASLGWDVRHDDIHVEIGDAALIRDAPVAIPRRIGLKVDDCAHP